MSYDEVQKVGAVKVEECFIVPNPELGLPLSSNLLTSWSTLFYMKHFPQLSCCRNVNWWFCESNWFYSVYGEIVTVKFRSLIEDSPNNVIQQSFIVSGITNRNFKEDRTVLYFKIDIFEGYKDQTVNISKRFTGTPEIFFKKYMMISFKNQSI